MLSWKQSWTQREVSQQRHQGAPSHSKHQGKCCVLLQLRNAELEAELDALREEANRRIRELEGGNQEQAQAAQQQGQELQARRREVATLEAKLQSRSGVLADHSERAKQLQQVGPLLLVERAAQVITCKAAQLEVTRRQQHGHSHQLAWAQSCIFEPAK